MEQKIRKKMLITFLKMNFSYITDFQRLKSRVLKRSLNPGKVNSLKVVNLLKIMNYGQVAARRNLGVGLKYSVNLKKRYKITMLHLNRTIKQLIKTSKC